MDAWLKGGPCQAINRDHVAVNKDWKEMWAKRASVEQSLMIQADLHEYLEDSMEEMHEGYHNDVVNVEN